ncbi:alternate-type signal peptide domain-containing protein [Nocardioides sp.]|uniref:alternate-type signal peptide domain-containing protein n=1 Tax=Nocardioides sp. TaxID=35761 RepID=UPI002724F519|nr:alternate-type signal peptide domain-containing protein [Nocardioides sp.]MDO9457444.1 alternate-type signal peptide domain-containing protein [Nocardioides sp.]
MKKTTKGALAASTAAVLLLGGAGSLAYWTATGTANGGAITAGKLTLSNGTCDANWVYAPGALKAGTTVALFVPGDKVTKKCTFTIGATGDNLSATVSAPSTVAFTSAPTGTSFSITNAATYAISGGTNPRTVANAGVIDSRDNTGVLTATFVATVPFGTDETGTPKINANDTQNLVATLNTLTVSLTQINPNPGP